jgi:hypothetical protein
MTITIMITIMAAPCGRLRSIAIARGEMAEQPGLPRLGAR